MKNQNQPELETQETRANDANEAAFEVFKQEAWDTFLTVDFWFRRKYNLAPTDPRFLEATHEEMMVDFYRHQFIVQYSEAKREGREVNSYTDLMLDESFDKALAEFDKQLEAEAAAKVNSIGGGDGDDDSDGGGKSTTHAPPVTRPAPVPELAHDYCTQDNCDDREVLIAVRAPKLNG